MAQTVKESKTPWRNTGELKRFWALARRYGGDDFVYDTIYLRYGAEKLHEIARHQFLELFDHMQKSESMSRRDAETQSKDPGGGSFIEPCGCDTHHGAASCGQYRRIMWLSHRLGWDALSLNAYIKKYAHIDSMRFFTAAKARGIISGMQKMSGRRHTMKKGDTP